MHNTKRPYLVIPKLIEQPTWGGTYIAETKGWQSREDLSGKKIGQSYELYDKSNLSLLTDSADTKFCGELTDNKRVKEQSEAPDSVALRDLIADDAAGALGAANAKKYGNEMHLLLKFTQALGNSFQLHVKDGATLDSWKPKPESWYYFEPGLITCGVKKDTDWDAYKTGMITLDRDIRAVSADVKTGALAYEKAKDRIADLIRIYDPWQYVNTVRVEKGTLLDLSPCGIHHSWEEDLKTIPLGNVLYEIQLNVMDDVATLRSFDKGKMGKDGTLRDLQIEEYFLAADRSPQANDPDTHMRKADSIAQTDSFLHERLLTSMYYSMDRLTLYGTGEFSASIDSFRHLFVRDGSASVKAGEAAIEVTAGHSVFIPAACGSYTVTGRAGTEILISY